MNDLLVNLFVVGNGFSASVETPDGDWVSLTEAPDEVTAAEACWEAAQILRSAAERFDMLALSANPTLISERAKVNAT